MFLMQRLRRVSALRLFWPGLLALALSILCAFLLWRSLARRAAGGEGAYAALEAKKGVAYLGRLPALLDAKPASRWQAIHASSTWMERLRQGRGEALAQALESRGFDTVVVFSRPESPTLGATLEQRFRQRAFVPGFRAWQIHADWIAYRTHAAPTFDAKLGKVVAEVARSMLGGEAAPRLSSFPSALRRRESAEVMVLLRDGRTPRIWRSVRSHSFASALIAAVGAVRQRWQQRISFMGVSLKERLPQLVVEVQLLLEDGTLMVAEGADLEAALSAEHGIGFETQGMWRYLLPNAAHTPKVRQALDVLLRANGLASESLPRPGLRLYRFVPILVGVSP